MGLFVSASDFEQDVIEILNKRMPDKTVTSVKFFIPVILVRLITQADIFLLCAFGLMHKPYSPAFLKVGRNTHFVPVVAICNHH